MEQEIKFVEIQLAAPRIVPTRQAKSERFENGPPDISSDEGTEVVVKEG
jgi:hypothetical protein